MLKVPQKARNIEKQNSHISATGKISIPFQCRSGHVQSSQQQGTMACLPKVREYNLRNCLTLYFAFCFLFQNHKPAGNVNIKSKSWNCFWVLHFDAVKSGWWQRSHHLLVVWIKGLLDQRKLLSTQLPVGVDKLGKLDTQKSKEFRYDS